ncbi:response regulator [soil metagenome]
MTKIIDILYIEDNLDHVLFVTKALKKINENINVISVDNGREALAMLKRFDQEDSVLPKLILLDLNMPGLSGLDILKEVKADEDLKLIPITMFSTSDSEEDVKRSASLGANAYVVKPSGYQKLVECLSQICGFWLKTNQVTLAH